MRSYLRQLARCLMVRWRLLMPTDCACSMAAATGSSLPSARARRAESVGKTVGDGKW